MDRKQKEILVVGGKLQGVEIAFLAREAGHRVTVADRNRFAPAVGIAHEAACVEFTDEKAMCRLFSRADYVFPAVEDAEILEKLCKYRDITGTSLIFDPGAYAVSSSKTASKQLFERVGVRCAKPFPDCGFPVIVKPDSSSGSHGVVLISDLSEWKKCVRGQDAYVAEQYLDGPSYSLEVLGCGAGGGVEIPMITEIIIDKDYDCKRVIAPAAVSEKIRKEFMDIAERINGELQIDGIFDIEVILHEGALYVLEIDARFPSQTPIAVYFASDVNFVEELICLREERHREDLGRSGFCQAGTVDGQIRVAEKERKVSCYQQMDVCDGAVEILGERIMADAGILHMEKNCCGAELLMSNYKPGAGSWRAIAVLTADEEAGLRRKTEDCERKAAVRGKL
ncbi:MAG: 3-methylornithine--L-lysine ligase PylC [Clostridiales bacterium]|nr:3-methylornithine--L-lysine ligase PylC [Clostridiales bacterium]